MAFFGAEAVFYVQKMRYEEEKFRDGKSPNSAESAESICSDKRQSKKNVYVEDNEEENVQKLQLLLNKLKELISRKSKGGHETNDQGEPSTSEGGTNKKKEFPFNPFL